MLTHYQIYNNYFAILQCTIMQTFACSLDLQTLNRSVDSNISNILKNIFIWNFLSLIFAVFFKGICYEQSLELESFALFPLFFTNYNLFTCWTSLASSMYCILSQYSSLFLKKVHCLGVLVHTLWSIDCTQNNLTGYRVLSIVYLDQL